jgi:hypothetical protein
VLRLENKNSSAQALASDTMNCNERSGHARMD